MARIRAANTQHGRYSREQVAVVRRVRTMQRNGLRSARRLEEPARSSLVPRAQVEAACFEAYPVQIREDVRAQVRAKLAGEEQERLQRLAETARKRNANRHR